MAGQCTGCFYGQASHDFDITEEVVTCNREVTGEGNRCDLRTGRSLTGLEHSPRSVLFNVCLPHLMKRKVNSVHS